MEHFLNALAAHIAAGLLLGLLAKVAKRVAERLGSAPVVPQRTLLRQVYMGRFLDFYLGHARPAFASIVSFVLLLNLLGVGVVKGTQGILFLDTTGTALAALTLGPWWAATIGIVTNILGTLITGTDTHYHTFGIVNAMLGIFWGYYAVFARRTVTQLDLTNIGGFLRTAAFMGLLGALISSPISGYLLLYPLSPGGPPTAETHVGDSFHIALYNAVGSNLASSDSLRWLVFTACQLPFNCADKITSVLIALALLHLLFPVVKVFDSVAPVMNFITLSAGSHIAFAVTYGLAFISLNDNLQPYLLWMPIALCLTSYLAMAAFVPRDLRGYYSLAEYFQHLSISVEEQRKRSALLIAVVVTIVMVFLYIAAVVWGSVSIGVSREEAMLAFRTVLSLTVTLLLFMFSGANLWFVSRRLRHAEDQLAVRLEPLAHRDSEGSDRGTTEGSR